MGEKFEKPIKVTISDRDSGEVLESRVVANDYCIICAGNRYVKSVQIMGHPARATHMIAVAVKKAIVPASTPDLHGEGG